MTTELNKSMKYEDILLSFESEIYKSIPLYTREALAFYFLEHYSPGNGIKFLLQNDAVNAIRYLDKENSKAIYEIYHWCYNYLPWNSWGNFEKVNNWIMGSNLNEG